MLYAILGHTYTKKIIHYVNFKYNWMSYILSGNPVMIPSANIPLSDLTASLGYLQ